MKYTKFKITFYDRKLQIINERYVSAMSKDSAKILAQAQQIEDAMEYRVCEVEEV